MTAAGRYGETGYPLFVRRVGAGRPLVLLHGLAASSRYWEPHFERLGAAYTIYAPDLLGFGRSPKPSASAYDLDAHLTTLADSVLARLDRPATVVGHSAGATVALALAARYPEAVERLVLSSLPLFSGQLRGHHDGGTRFLHGLTVHSRAGSALVELTLAGLRPAWSRLWPALRPDIPRGSAEEALLASWQATWGMIERVVYAVDVPSLIEQTPAPVHLIHGVRDWVARVEPVQGLAAAYPHLDYIEIADGWHNPCYSHPHLLYALLGVEGDCGRGDGTPAEAAPAGAAGSERRPNAVLAQSLRAAVAWRVGRVSGRASALKNA